MGLKTRLASLLTGVVVVAAVTVAGLDTASAESNGGVRVMPLGDSITDGFNVPGGYRIELWSGLRPAGTPSTSWAPSPTGQPNSATTTTRASPDGGSTRSTRR